MYLIRTKTHTTFLIWREHGLKNDWTSKGQNWGIWWFYYPFMRTGLCNLWNVYKWLILFVFMHDSITKSLINLLIKVGEAVKLTWPIPIRQSLNIYYKY